MKNKRKMKKSLLFAIVFAIAMLTTTWIGSNNTVSAASPTISKTNVSVDRGKQYKLRLKNVKASSVKWSSSKKAVAIVSKSGVVTATITIKSSGGLKKTITIGTKVTASSISISPTSLTLNIGDSKKISVIVTPINGEYNSRGWFSSDTSVAQVDKDGNVTAVGAGTATIRMSYSYEKNSSTTVMGSAVCNIIVKEPE